MEFVAHDETKPFSFADFTLRELTPGAFEEGSIAEVVVPIGADRPERENLKRHRIYVGLAGDVEFEVDGATVHVRPGDLLHIGEGERYRFHNGGYEEAKLLLIRMPGPSLPENY
ncbi:MAG TPA: cupin domain-containing protein [Actinobacteria bacterium]|nr:cupin domain-containing protein [Actinomycetota bacterium]